MDEVYMVATFEVNDHLNIKDWYIYLVNETTESLETVLVVAHGRDGEKKTAVTRHKIEVLPPKAFARIEFLQDDVLSLENVYYLSFFSNNKLFYKEINFEKGCIKLEEASSLKVLGKKGIVRR